MEQDASPMLSSLISESQHDPGSTVIASKAPFPAELLLMIFHNVDDKDLLSVALSSKAVHDEAITVLFERDSQRPHTETGEPPKVPVWAVYNDMMPTMKRALLHGGAKAINERGHARLGNHTEPFTPLCYAAWVGKMEFVKLFLEHGARIEEAEHIPTTELMTIPLLASVEMTALGMALMQGHTETAELLLAKGASVEVGWEYTQGNVTSLAYNALHAAALHDNGDMIERLVREFGCSVTDISTTYQGHLLPIHWAIFTAQGAVNVQRLVSLGADVNARVGVFEDGTPLHWAIHGIPMFRNDNTTRATAAALLAAGADINALDRQRNSPLSMAVYLFQGPIVSFLLNWGADVHAGHDETLVRAMELIPRYPVEREVRRCFRLMLGAGAALPEQAVEMAWEMGDDEDFSEMLLAYYSPQEGDE
ncbi:ankyrin repeat-containing domain protein [Stachybotrys elegans]|uniref:Ankyrin repeat-containing domain protein n=1 Tax=Stachybotrys elegans TaxID=80388 RepID=A0A8K0SVV8_9HYPO|nr:ankyrin repeat-containing domain protein [Stachybotrys elegans]